MFCQKLYATLMSKAARLGFRDKTPSAGSLGTVLPQTDRCRSYPVKHEQMTQKNKINRMFCPRCTSPSYNNEETSPDVLISSDKLKVELIIIQ